MPAFDGTGPLGQGPMTGRGLGYCSNGYGVVYPRVGYGYGFGRGLGFSRRFGGGFGRGIRRGFGRGFGRRFW
jgi:hypothetical protein